MNETSQVVLICTDVSHQTIYSDRGSPHWECLTSWQIMSCKKHVKDSSKMLKCHQCFVELMMVCGTFRMYSHYFYRVKNFKKALTYSQQESIPGGCVLPACQKYVCGRYYTVHEEHTILLCRRHRTMVASGKIYFEA